MCLGVGLWVHLYWNSMGSWIWISASFLRLGKFSAIISSSKFSIPFSLSSPSRTCIMCMLSHEPLSYLHSSSFFHPDLLIGWVPLPYECVVSSASSVHWTSVVFSVHLLYSSALVTSIWYCLFVGILIVPTFSPELHEHLYDHYFELWSGKSFISIWLRLFLAFIFFRLELIPLFLRFPQHSVLVSMH